MGKKESKGMKRANIIVSTLYESLSSSAIDCAGFVLAVEDGLRRFPDLQILDREDRSVEYFFVHLVFDEIDDELRAAAVAVGFHTSNLLEPPEGSDYFLRQFAGH